MGRTDDIQKQLLVVFQTELEEHVVTLNKGLLALEKEPEAGQKADLLAEIFRAAHSLKGAARGVGITDVETLAHKIEDVLAAIRHTELEFSPLLFDALFPLIDALSEAMSAFLDGARFSVSRRDNLFEVLQFAIQGEQHPEKTTGRQHLPEVRSSSLASFSTEDTIRVSTAKLDSLMDDVGELLTARMRSEQRLSELRELQTLLVDWQSDWRGVRAQFHQMQSGDGSGTENRSSINNGSNHSTLRSPYLVKFLWDNEVHLQSAQKQINEIIRMFSEDHGHHSLLIDSLQDSVRRARMLPIATLFDSLPRLVRDLARDQGKQVALRIVGAETEVDRQMLEIMKDPLIHLLRNAVDHGIQSPSIRETSGKQALGTIDLIVTQRGNTIIVQVADDGAGINMKKVRQAVVKRGLLSPEAVNDLSEPEVLDLIFYTGLSTQDEVSEVSGRGVGLDVVRQNLERLNGLINVDTIPGEGTTFTLTMPLTLATSHVLLIEAAGQTVAAPTAAIERILRIDASEIHYVEGKPAIEFDSRPLPLIHLNQILGLPVQKRSYQTDQKVNVVVMGAAEKRAAFQVEKLDTTQEVVVKNIGAQLRRVPNIAGATILGSGEVVMVLNVSDLMKSINSGAVDSRQTFIEISEPRRRQVLVVDDSITTRTLEKNILENAGFSVIVAANGQEAWGLLQYESLDVVVADIDMPRMDGIELTNRIKKDQRHQNTPVILVTSLESPQDKIKGMEAGADAYIVKSDFDQQELLKSIERLIG